jgi:hypothetical protein
MDRVGGPLLILAGAAFTGFVVLQNRAPSTSRVSPSLPLPYIASGVFFTLAGRGNGTGRSLGGG